MYIKLFSLKLIFDCMSESYLCVIKPLPLDRYVNVRETHVGLKLDKPLIYI